METEHLFAQSFLTMHPEEAAAELERLPSSDAAALLTDTPPQVSATVLRSMGPFSAAACLTNLASEPAGEILAALPLDSAAVLLRRMDNNSQEAILLDKLPSIFHQLWHQFETYQTPHFDKSVLFLHRYQFRQYPDNKQSAFHLEFLNLPPP